MKFSIAMMLAVMTACTSQISENLETTPADHVTTLMGTLSEYALSTGNTYPATALPWGMNFWTPQTGKMGAASSRLTSLLRGSTITGSSS